MKKEHKNISGIAINDSITMSVKTKRKNLREFESILIAMCGYFGIIMFFINTFDIPFNKVVVFSFATVFALIYSAVTVVRERMVWAFPCTLGLMVVTGWRYSQSIKTGFRLIFNIMYKTLTDTGINYFKSVSPLNSEKNITVFLIFALWVFALVIFFFTVYRPNILIIIATTFPIVELCLYYGIEVPVIWTSMMFGYWFAVLSVCSSDLGEYYGGNSGFTRKDDMFFPKRKMKFKVTEKCGIFTLVVIMFSSIITNTVIELTGYERTEKIKEQRRELKYAISSFSMEDLASSISDITESLGFVFEYQDNRLGTYNKISYSGKTDLTITIDNAPQGALYLKGFTASEYKNNEWFELDDKIYSQINEMFEKYNIYPQEFTYIFNSELSDENQTNQIKITSQKKNKKAYIPYGTLTQDGFTFSNDNSIKLERDKTYSFEFIMPSIDIAERLFNSCYNFNIDFNELEFTDEQENNISAFCNEYSVSSLMANVGIRIYYANYNLMLSTLVENQYREFVYENYLDYPQNEAFDEIYQAYADILDNAKISTTSEKLETLRKIKDKMNENVEYTLEPGRTPSSRDFVNYFLLENKKGYCVHYATAGVMLARMAGIPARYVTGYVSVGDDYNDSTRNDDGSYTVNLADNRSHAWCEVYIDGYGWIPFEFTAGYSDTSISSEQIETTAVTETITQTYTTTVTSVVTDTSVTKNQSSSISKATSTIKTLTTAITQSSVVYTSTVNSNSFSNNIKNMIISENVMKKIVCIILILLLIFVRRWIIIIQRNRKLNSGTPIKRVLNSYRYVRKILRYKGMKRKNLQYGEFADNVEEKFSGILFEQGDFIKFNDVVLKCAFGNTIPENDELEFAVEFSKSVPKRIYSNSNIFLKIYLKLILVLV